jgi:hypothetical protein
MAALDLVQRGVSVTTNSVQETTPSAVHPQLGPLIMVPRKEIEAMLTQLFVVAEFSRDMVEQLAALEKKTGLSASELSLGRYAGIPVPREAEALMVDDGALFAVVSVPSSLMPGQMVTARKELARADCPTASGEVFTLENLHAAKEQFDVEHTAH